MTLTGTRVTATTTATLLAAADADEATGISVMLRIPASGSTIDIGASTVTTGNGYALNAGETITVQLRRGEAIYAITATGSQPVHVLKLA